MKLINDPPLDFSTANIMVTILFPHRSTKSVKDNLSIDWKLRESSIINNNDDAITDILR